MYSCMYIYIYSSSTNHFEDTIHKNIVCPDPELSWVPLVRALGYSKTLEKPFRCSATLKKTLSFTQPLEKNDEKSLVLAQTAEQTLIYAQPLEKTVKKSLIICKVWHTKFKSQCHKQT